MSQKIKISKGLKINLPGDPEKIYAQSDAPSVIALKPTDIPLMIPKLSVRQGDEVKAGEPLFYDKDRPDIIFPSPVSGEVAEVVRGEKRKILEVRVVADQAMNYKDFGSADPLTLDRDGVKQKMLDSGVWSFIRERPFGGVANPNHQPKAIFVSGLDTHPLSADVEFSLHGQESTVKTALSALTQLTDGSVNVCIAGDMEHGSVFAKAASELKGVNVHRINGPHPAGNVGVQIHAIDPLNKGEVAWTVGPHELLYIGRLFDKGHFDATKIVAVGGSGVNAPKHFKTILGAPVQLLLDGNMKTDREYRIISGSPLTGEQITREGFVGYFDNQVAVIPEGKDPKFFITDGWASPGFNRFSASRAYPTWLLGGGKRYDLDTNINGEERAFVVTGQYEQVFPFKIYPVQLIKAILANDIELMENLGIYEVLPEDFALCDFVCTSKIEAQQIVQKGIETMKQELG